MADNTYDKVKNFINKHCMIKSGDLIAAGVSGGADSVCLLHLMWRLSKEIPYSLIVVHVDHSVRAESMEDAAYVERLCRDMGIPFYLKKVNMAEYAAEHGMSPEEAGRQLRYESFAEILHEAGKGMENCKIAVAHNANDRAETMLFHLFRGSGIKGLSSIRPVRDSVIRPLLCLERYEIEQYLDKRGINYCRDSSNEEDLYTRNKIRHHILPYAEQEICSGLIAHMGELADILTETETYLEKQTKCLYEDIVEDIVQQEKPIGLRIKTTELLEQDSVMCKRVLLMCMERLVFQRKDITGKHIADLISLMKKEGCKELSLPYGIKAYKEYNSLILCRDHRAIGFTGECEQDDVEYQIIPPMEIFMPMEGFYTFTLLENKDIFCGQPQNIPENRYTKWFDYDKITTTLLLRTRRQGDYLTIGAMLHTKSLKQYMINEKIPKLRRDSMHILADGAHVMWVPGYRISERYKVDENTTRILQVQLRGG